MIILAIALTAWAILRKYARKPVKHTAAQFTTVPAISPAELQRREKERERAQKEAEREEAKRQKEAEARAQAEEDIPYLETQLSRYYEMIEDAKADLRLARQRVKHDAEMNEHGAIIAEKVVNKHITERDKLMKKVITLENQIHAAEKKLSKAQQIAQN